ncbi:MAG: DUF7133 domain-containing protein, partial [Opitutaceae bacterium]
LFRGDALSAAHYGNAFICEPAQNLVQRQILAPAGATFAARIAHDGTEFLASPDTWFRPVFIATGPDGALYICDMHRKIIDHPQFLAAGSYDPADFHAGNNMGRIYRVISQDLKTGPMPKPKLASAGVQELCAYLSDANGWTRDTARRLLLERAEPASIPLLRTILESEKSEFARLLALCTLDGLGALEDEQIQLALADPNAGVRENAIRLAEARLSKRSDFASRVLALSDDPDSHVRFQCALTLGEIDDPRVIPALARIAARDMADRWARAGVLSSLGTRTSEFLRAFLAVAPKSSDAMSAMMADLCRILASQSPEKCLTVIADLTASRKSEDEAWQAGALTGLAEGLRSRGSTKGNDSALMKLAAGDALARDRLIEFMRRSAKTMQDPTKPTRNRLVAIGLLSESSYAIAGEALRDLINVRQPVEIQVAATRALARMNNHDVTKALIKSERWRTYQPAVREALVAALMNEPKLLSAFLDEIESGRIAPMTIDSNRRTQLMKHRDTTVAKRAEAVFKNGIGGDRRKVMDEYRSILPLQPTPANGHAVFQKLCAQCHTYAGEGAPVGPDLTGVRNQPAETLLLHILMPSYEVQKGFEATEVATKDGRTLLGFIASETEASITLRRPFAEPETILRSSIATISILNVSLMPDGLEAAMTKQDLRDVIGYLNKGRDAQ